MLGLAVVLVVGIAWLLDYSTDGSGGEEASVVAASPTTTTTPAPTSTRHGRKLTKAEKKARREERQQLAQPQGPCDDGDVLVTPKITDAHAGSPVKIVLEVTTAESPACYWDLEPDSVFVNIQDDEDTTIWSSQQCPRAVPHRDAGAAP